MPKHARLSASSAHRWIHCPGSVELSAPYVEAPEPEPAEEVIETKEEKKMGKNYEQIEDVWEALKAGQEVFAVDFGNMVVYSLDGCTIGDIREAMESEDTLFFRERSNA